MIRHPRFLLRLALCGVTAVALLAPAGCQVDPPKPPRTRYANRGKRPVPEFMKGTIYETADLENDSPFLISGWGLVVNLDGTGGSDQVPNVVKAYMVKEMERKGFGSMLMPTYTKVDPGLVLHDKNAAVVAVYGWLPPGARKGQWFDIALKAEGREVTSLARGLLFTTDLTIDGADPVRPPSSVNIFASAYGPVFVNPAVALRGPGDPGPAAQRSLRAGFVMAGGQVARDRPLLLRLREPQNRISRAIEARVNEYFHEDKIAAAFDEGQCQLWVPPRFKGDWEHFAKVVQHLYINGGSEAFARAKARQLVEQAMQPNAPLQDISYCWEGLGRFALPSLAPLLSDGPQEVRFAAARAAAYIGDPSGAAEHALYDLARTEGSPFQISAVQVLGRIQNSRMVNHLLRQLLDSDQTMVRVEAYNILSANDDPSVQRRIITPADNPSNQKFFLDVVQSHGRPLIYATRSGVPRIAIFGDVPELSLPVTFGAMDNHFMISSGAVGRAVTIFYRDSMLDRAVQMNSGPDVAEIIARLAGSANNPAAQFDFTYAEVLAILQGLSDQQKIQVVTPTGEQMATAFVMSDPPAVRDAIGNAPLLDRGRPQGDTNAPSIDASPRSQAPANTAEATALAPR